MEAFVYLRFFVDFTSWFTPWYPLLLDTLAPVPSQKMSSKTETNPRWRHQMETFSAVLALCAGNSSMTGEFPAQRPMTRSFDVFFDLSLNKRLSKQSWAGDLRRHRAHYDVIDLFNMANEIEDMDSSRLYHCVANHCNYLLCNNMKILG